MLWFVVVVEGARVRRAPMPMPMPTASPWRAKPRGEPKVAAAPTVLCAGIICVGIPRSFSLFLLMLLSSFGSHQNRWSAQIYVFSPQSFFFVGMFHALLSSAPEKDDDCWWCVSIFFYLHTLVRPSGTPLGVGRRHFSAMGISDGDFVHDFMYSARLLYCCCYFVCWGGSLQQIMYAFMGLGTKFDALAGSEVVYAGKRNDERNITMPPIWWGQPPEIRRTTRLDDPRVSV